MELPSVSVIVLNYNGLRYMQECFASLSALEYPIDRVELVLADNGSSDGSVEYVRQNFPKVRIIAFEQNYGFCRGNNKASEQVGSEFVAFLNSDMRVEPHWLLGLVNALGNAPDAICASSKILTWDGKAIDFGGTLISFLGRATAEGYHEPDKPLYDTVRAILAPCGGAMLISRKIFLEVGGFDEAYGSYYEDVDLGWRLWILGYKVLFAPQSICYHVHFGTSSKKSPAQMAYILEKNALFTILKNYEQRYLDQILPLALMLQFKHIYLLARTSGVDMDRCRFENKVQRPSSEEEPLQYDMFWYEHAQITAMNDVVDHFDDIMTKRKLIQDHRRRKDMDIFSRTNSLTLAPWFGSSEYQQAHYQLMNSYGISAIFGGFVEPSGLKNLMANDWQHGLEHVRLMYRRVIEPLSQSREKRIRVSDRETLTEAQRVAQDKDRYWSQIVQERDAALERQTKERIALEQSLARYHRLLPLRLYFWVKRTLGKA
jgi:GT2 family glycosyltransferase